MQIAGPSVLCHLFEGLLRMWGERTAPSTAFFRSCDFLGLVQRCCPVPEAQVTTAVNHLMSIVKSHPEDALYAARACHLLFAVQPSIAIPAVRWVLAVAGGRRVR
jgi:hypothetical protein